MVVYLIGHQTNLQKVLGDIFAATSPTEDVYAWQVDVDSASLFNLKRFLESGKNDAIGASQTDRDRDTKAGDKEVALVNREEVADSLQL